jgi:hypothetical protein
LAILAQLVSRLRGNITGWLPTSSTYKKSRALLIGTKSTENRQKRLFQTDFFGVSTNLVDIAKLKISGFIFQGSKVKKGRREDTSYLMLEVQGTHQSAI